MGLDIVERVKELLEPILEEKDLTLVDVEYVKEGKPVLRIYIYNPEGTSIENCEFVSRRIGAILDVEDLIPSSYILEVSSPGLDRKLKNKEEYEIFKGRNIKIVTAEPIEKQNVFKGKLLGLEDENVLLQEENKEDTTKIPLQNIAKAQLDF